MTLATSSTETQQQIVNVNLYGNNTFNIISGNQTNNVIHNYPPTSAGFAAGNRDHQSQGTSSSNGNFSSNHHNNVSIIQAIPRLSTMFTGRKDILERLGRFLDPSNPSVVLKKQRIFVLYGLGGAGKTQIMSKFVIEFGDQFSAIYYIDATTLGTIQSSFENIARSTCVGTTVDDALRWLSQQRSEWLLLIDNADDPEINLQQFLPHCIHGNILITTRNPDCRRYAPDSNFNVAEMNPNDAVDLLLKSAMVERSAKNRDIGASICQELGYLALAIAQAGAYIAQACSLSDYLRIYREDRARLLRLRPAQAVDDYKWTVYTTWEMNLARLTPTAAMLLRLSAFIHHDGIPRALFANAASATVHEPEPFRDATHFLANFRSECGEWSNQMFLETVKELTSYSLINVDAGCEMYSIHPLVHSWARERASTPDCDESRTCMLQLLALSIPHGHDAEAYAFRRALLPHVGVACPATQHDQIDPNVWECFYWIYFHCQHWRGAEDVQKAVLEATRNLGDEINNLGKLTTAIMGQGRWKDAEALHLQVLEMRQRTLGQEHVDTLKSMQQQATIYKWQGQLKKAEVLQVQVLDIRKKVLGVENDDTLCSMNNLAAIYWRQGRLKKAKALQMQVLEIRQKVHGHEHPNTFCSMANLALIYARQGQLQKAEVLQVQVLGMTQKVLGLEHPFTLYRIGNLALTYRKQQRWKEAEILQVQVLEMMQKILGLEHPHTLGALYSLASTYCWQKQRNKAKESFAELLACQKRVLGHDHPNTIRTEGWIKKCIFLDQLSWHPTSWLGVLKLM